MVGRFQIKDEILIDCFQISMRNHVNLVKLTLTLGEIVMEQFVSF